MRSVGDYRERARRRLPHFLFEYIDGGSGDEITLARNLDDLRRVQLRQRVLRDVGDCDTAMRMFGRELSLPVVLGPIGLAGLNARRGEVQASRAARHAGVPFTLSTVSVCDLAEVAVPGAPPPWFQLYMIRDRGFMQDLLAKATELGCPVLVFTVDMPVPGIRYRDYRSGLAGAGGARGGLRRLLQAVARPGWAWDVGLWGRPHHLGNVAPVLTSGTGLEDFMLWMRDNFDPSVTWDDLAWIRQAWPGALVVKGILDVEDARRCVQLGADGLVVSNHGGRQLDGAPSTAAALPPIADAVGGDIAILADGGVRSGLDVFRMLALGADAVMLGRAWAYALAAEGEAGVSHMLDQIAAELRVSMALTGATCLGEVTRDRLAGQG